MFGLIPQNERFRPGLTDSSGTSLFNWRDLCPAHRTWSDFGLRNIGHLSYEVRRPSGAVIPVYSMLTIYELVLLHGLSRRWWQGWGEICDLGPYYGLTTYCFQQGLRRNPQYRVTGKPRIHSYDLFLSYAEPGISIFNDYATLNKLRRNSIAVYPGDICALKWTQAPIEILFLDLLKSVEIQDHVVREFFPSLRVGSLIIQQDYVHFAEWWIHVFMELYKDHFELLECVFASTAVFRLIAPLPDLSNWRLGKIAENEVIRLHRQHVLAAPEAIRPVLWVAHAQMLSEFGQVAQAKTVLDRVNPRPGKDPATDFCDIAVGNRKLVSESLGI